MSLALASGTTWAFVELGRPPGSAPVAPIVIGESGSGDGAVDDDPGEGEPDGSGGSPSGGAEPPPAPPPPPAGDDGDDDDRSDDGDD